MFPYLFFSDGMYVGDEIDNQPDVDMAPNQRTVRLAVSRSHLSSLLCTQSIPSTNKQTNQPTNHSYPLILLSHNDG